MEEPADQAAVPAPGFVATKLNQAAAALGITVEDLKALREMPGFPGSNGKYDIDAIRSWMGSPTPGDGEADGTRETTPLAPAPIVADVLGIEIPLAEPPANSRYATCSGSFDNRLKRENRHTFRRVLYGLVSTGAKLADGRPVSTQADLTRWLMDTLEAKLAAKSA